jgi:hypothetical protein
VYQLRAFARGTGTPDPLPATEAQQTMEVIDQMYLKAGLPLRGLSRQRA